IAGGRLYVAASDADVFVFDPEDGAPLGRVRVANGVSAAPAVARGTLLVLSNTGWLHAFQ
ncbi:MAG: quinoprotein, partial [Pseudomonadota bacterium]